MNYHLYYYIPWPDSQKVSELDPEGDYTSWSGEGLFAEKEWFDLMNKQHEII